MEKLRIVVGGYIGSYCTSGVTWDYIQCPLGLHLMGHDVYYIEDTLGYYCHPNEPEYSYDDVTPIVKYFNETMKYFGLEERWAYRDANTGNCYGISLDKLKEVCKTADVFINVSHSTYMREEYLKIPKRVLIDSDPMFTQIQRAEELQFSESLLKDQFSAFNHLFSFGENINGIESRIPKYDLNWKTTRQPICLKYWCNSGIKYARKSYSTVMNWSERKNILYNNEGWGQKNVEFEKVLEVPTLFPKATFDLVLSCNPALKQKSEFQKILDANWNVLEPLQTIKEIDDYKGFIERSIGEFSVAKHSYVKSNSGWFSCRSACYLAAGRPVVVQETKWSNFIPSGNGAIAFTNIDNAIVALEEVYSNWNKHSNAATELAYEYFDSNKVLTQLIENLN